MDRRYQSGAVSFGGLVAWSLVILFVGWLAQSWIQKMVMPVEPYWWTIFIALLVLGFIRSSIADHTHAWQDMIHDPLIAPDYLLNRTSEEKTRVSALRQSRLSLNNETKDIDIIFEELGIPKINNDGKFDRRFRNADFLESKWERAREIEREIRKIDQDLLEFDSKLEARSQVWANSVVQARSAWECITPCIQASAIGLVVYFFSKIEAPSNGIGPIAYSAATTVGVYVLLATRIRMQAWSKAEAALNELRKKGTTQSSTSSSSESGNGSQRSKQRKASSDKDSKKPQEESRTPKSWWEVLGVTPSSSQEEIRSAYRSLMRQYHPDKVATLGPELRELAERKATEINAAYVEAKQGD